MAGFGLQFLNGLGESQDQGVAKNDLENKSFVSDDDFEVEMIDDQDTDVADKIANSPSETPYQEEKSKIVTAKNLLIFLAGAATGLLVRKLINKRK